MVNQNMNRNNCNCNNCGGNNNGNNSGSNISARQGRNGSMNMKNDKNCAMQSIYELGFVLIETMLFLDTHPDNQEAIDYYMDMKDKYREALERFADFYGPINMTNMSSENYWMWVATPMPWEMEDC